MTYTVHWSSQINGDSGAYAPANINKNTISLADNTSDSSTTLTLMGKGFSNYGRIQQENFIRLMENFASINAPVNPTIGQLWYDTDAQSLKLYNVTLPGSPQWGVIFPISGAIGYTPYNATNPSGYLNPATIGTAVFGTANQVTITSSGSGVTLSLPQNINTTADAQFNNLTLNAQTANSFIYLNGTKTIATTAPTNGQLLIGSTGATPVIAALTAGTGIGVTNGAGSITVANTGVTSNVAGTGIGVSGSTGAVTISNTGVTSITAGSGIDVSSLTGAVTISNIGVRSITGTTNQVIASSSTGTITLSLPQNIHSTASPTFNNLTINGHLSANGGADFSGTVTVPTITIAPGSSIVNAQSIINYMTANQALTEYGYKIWPNGMIEQWGIIHGVYVASGIGSSLTVSYGFPIAFPSEVWQVSFCNIAVPESINPTFAGQNRGEAGELITCEDLVGRTLAGTTSFTVRVSGSNDTPHEDERIYISWRAIGK